MLRLKRAACLIAIMGSAAGMGTLTPARAETIALACSRTAEDQASLVRMGYPTMAATVIHVSLDTSAQTATDWSTYPGDTYPIRPTVYQATIASAMATWSTPPDDEDGSKAVRTLERNTNVLTTTDPAGKSVLWNCS